MPAYGFFDNLDVVDAAKLAEYKERVAPIVARFGGRYVVVGGRVDVMEGQWSPVYPVMIEFPTFEDLHAWYASEEYRELKALRLSAARGNAVFFGT
ncbi:MAG: DUF1330 domain-containing protein [Gemmatimonadetes bacterium]|nr:DUF1330 domain-containing protein [Gemmatimonadota bacterium]